MLLLGQFQEADGQGTQLTDVELMKNPLTIFQPIVVQFPTVGSSDYYRTSTEILHSGVGNSKTT